jgi:predicted HD phosphohydrolase
MDFISAYWNDFKQNLVEKVIGGRADLYSEKPAEHLIAAAWQDPLGDVYTGNDHWSAANNAAQHHQVEAGIAIKFGSNTDQFKEYLRHHGWKDGYLTSTERWVTREEAAEISRSARQIKKKVASLDSSDIISFR